MNDEKRRKDVVNPVLLEALARVEQRKRCAFPFWANWGNWTNWPNWYDWGNWGNWGNWLNWHNGW